MAEGAMASMPSAASHHGRQAQWVPITSSEQCGSSQCYYSSNTSQYAGCFHITSRECTVLLQEQLQQGQQSSSTPVGATVTPPPTPNPITQMVQSEIPILLRLLNAPEDYILSPSDRAKILNKMWALLDEELDDSWEIMNVEFPGQYIGGARRLQSSLRGENRRRLSNVLYIPVVITLRGREVMSGMALDFILQAFRNKLDALLMYIKSLDPDALSNLQLSELSVDKMDLDDVDEGVRGPTLVIKSTDSSTSTKTETNSSTETTISVGTQSTGAASTGPPYWVWLIVAFVIIPLIICLILFMCRAGWCLCCGCFNKKRDSKEEYELQKQLAIERWRQQPVKKRRDLDPLDDLVNGRDGYESRRERDVRREHHSRRGDHGRRRHGDRRHNDRRNHQDNGSRRVKPVAKRSLSMIEKEIALAQLKLIEAGSEVETKYDEPVVAARPVPSYPAYLPTQNHGNDPSVATDNQNAVVVYDDEQIRFTMEPEGQKIDDVPKPVTTAVVLFNPPKEPEGSTLATPRRKSGRYYRHEKDEVYVCSPDELPPDVREKTGKYAQDHPRSSRSRRKPRRSYSDRLKESFTFIRADTRTNNGDSDDEDDVPPPDVQERTEDRQRSSRRKRRSYTDRLRESFTFMRADVVETEDSEEIERREKQRKREERKKRRSKKKRSNRSSSHKRHDESVPDPIDVESGSRPVSIATRPPDSDQDDALKRSMISRLSQSPIFSSFRRVPYGNGVESLDDESDERS